MSAAPPPPTPAIDAVGFRSAYRSTVQRAWRAHEPLSPLEWADRYRYLSDRVTSEPGFYRSSRTPYMREIHEALGDPKYNEVVVMAGAQSGKSETGRNFLGWIVDQSPGPVLIVFPTEKLCKRVMGKRVIPMFSDTPRLGRFVTGRAWDVTESMLTTTTCTITAGWSGSPVALSSDPYMVVILDEVDKYPAYRGVEADAISLGLARTTTYGHRATLYVLSTPTIPSGPIIRRYEASHDRRVYHVHCPACGDLAPFEWKHVTWPGKDSETEDDLREQREGFSAGLLEAVYVCQACQAEATDAQRWSMVSEGQWVSEGHEPGERPVSRTVAYKVPGLASPWQSFCGLAEAYLKARLTDAGALQHFFNSMLGVPFWGLHGDAKRVVQIQPAAIWAKAERGYERGVAPEWTRAIVSGADPGRGRIHYATRALGPGRLSRLIDFGVVADLEELRTATLSRRFHVDVSGRILSPLVLAVDIGGGYDGSGSTLTDAAYRFAKTDLARIRPVKGIGGAGTPADPATTRRITYHPPGSTRLPYEVSLTSIDTGYFKDVVAGSALDEDPDLWQLCSGISGDYAMQMCAEHKTLIKREVSAAGVVREIFRWIVRLPGAANHFWDCEVYAAVAAHMLGDALAGAQVDDSNPPERPKQTWKVGR